MITHEEGRPPDRGYPISIKGVLVRNGAVLLLKNDREEWELPGGRIELGETPEECVAREIREETSLRVQSGPVLDAWMYHIHQARKHVFVVTYGCWSLDREAPVLSHEHREIGLFPEAAVDRLEIPDGYRRSIATWFGMLRNPTPTDAG